jgi:hypothetical protein
MLSPRAAALTVGPGDLLACSSKGPVADIIRSVSPIYQHVAIISNQRPAIIAESTATSSLPDLETGMLVLGVQAHYLTDWLSAYQGSVFHYPLKTMLYQRDLPVLANFLENEYRGKVAYDAVGAMRLGLRRLGLIDWTAPTAGAVFCSEFACQVYQALGLLPAQPTQIGGPGLDSADCTPDDAASWPIFGTPVQLK